MKIKVSPTQLIENQKMLIYLYRGKCTATCGHGSSMASPLAISILEAPLK